jgi:hypothetical protein
MSFGRWRKMEPEKKTERKRRGWRRYRGTEIGGGRSE